MQLLFANYPHQQSYKWSITSYAKYELVILVYEIYTMYTSTEVNIL